MTRLKYIVLVALTACSVKEQIPQNQPQIRSIRASIEGNEPETRAGAVTELAQYVGRSQFAGGDIAVFTNIRRTDYAIDAFTYPTKGSTYTGVTFVAEEGGGWTRKEGDNAPERIYWTDAVSPHTFVAYCTPQDENFDWERSVETGGYPYYIGSLGRKEESGDIVFSSNADLEKEDLLICYDTQVKAETGGNVARVKFFHALSSVRVVVNINGFSAGASATADNATKVSNLRLLDQPTRYEWMQTNLVESSRFGENPHRDLRLWIPSPDGVGQNQAKTFTFYGITTPHQAQETKLSFDVTYPDPLNPSENKTHTYTASLENISFESGYNTTINITLNHRDEQMVVGVDFRDWEYVYTPDQSQLKKNSTFLYDTERKHVTIASQAGITADDATWLYESPQGKVYDVYGNDGTLKRPYQISTAYQMLSFAYEVKNGRSFKDQFVDLDADLTFEAAWIGIGDDKHPFEGTFLGGMRFIYGVKGSPLFASLAKGSRVEQLQVNAGGAIDGTGLFANENAGLICGCRVVDDVKLTRSVSGAFVGTNSGIILASYHVGATTGEAVVGGLAGANSGTLVGCYQAGKVTGSTCYNIAPGTLVACYFISGSMAPASYTSNLNTGIAQWVESNPGYDTHEYVHQPAGFPHLKY